MSADPLHDAAASLYEQHVPLLINTIKSRFGIPHEEALAVIHDTFVSFLRVGTQVRCPEQWLVAAACNAARQYLRNETRRHEVDDVDLVTTAHATLRAIDATRILAQLSTICREVLTAHYLEGHSAREVAVQRQTTTRYAEREIHRCLTRARQLLTEGEHARHR